MIEFTFTPIAKAHMERRGYGAREMLGTIPDMLCPSIPVSAVEQIDAAYRDIGGGWRDTPGLQLNIEAGTLTYPDDPPRQLIAQGKLRDERILFFDGAWIAVVQPDESYRVARID